MMIDNATDSGLITYIKDGRKIPEGQSNSLIDNKLTTPETIYKFVSCI